MANNSYKIWLDSTKEVVIKSGIQTLREAKQITRDFPGAYIEEVTE